MGLNEDVFRALNGAGNPVLDPVMIAFGVAGLFAVTLLWAFPLWFAHRRRDAIDLLVLLVLAEVLVFALKWSLAVERPAIGVQLAVPFDDVSDPSFPSGHAAFAFAAAVLFTARTRDWRWGVPLFGYAVLMALSRIYVGAHWPSDVLGGALVGAGVAIAFDRLARMPPYGKLRDKIVASLTRFGRGAEP